MEENKIIIYTANDGKTRIDVKLEEETLWLTQTQMCELYQTSRTNVVEHIKHIYEEGELNEEATCRKFRQVRQEGGRIVNREIPFYNLDMIIALGYRVRSIIATRFRQWATLRLKEYMVKGFTLDDERLKKLGGGGYWKELLERIRDYPCHRKGDVIVRCLKYMPPVLTMTQELPCHRSFSRKFRTRYIMRFTGIRQRSLSLNGLMQRKILWGC